MQLTDQEKAMLDGREGKAVQAAMELLYRYAKALGAERFVDVSNVLGGYMVANVPLFKKYGDFDALISTYCLDSDCPLKIGKVKVPSFQNQTHMESNYYEITGKTKDQLAVYKMNEAFNMNMGIQWTATCAPYQLGVTPVKGEHIAWMESSAVVYANSVLGARTNCEGKESTTAAMLTGKIPYWGYHITENRAGTHLIHVDCKIENSFEWGLLGYFTGKFCKGSVPVLTGIESAPRKDYLKHFGAATASAGGVELFHIPGITAEVNTLEEAFQGKKPVECVVFNEETMRRTYEELNFSGRDRHVDLIITGCPHYSLEELWLLAEYLGDRKIKDGVSFWIFMPAGLKEIASRQGLLRRVENAGILVMTDSCPCLGEFAPAGCRVMSTDSAKQAHYFPNILKRETWYGTMEQCVDAAVSGIWEGKL